jgi:hypothetical protein
MSVVIGQQTRQPWPINAQNNKYINKNPRFAVYFFRALG